MSPPGFLGHAGTSGHERGEGTQEKGVARLRMETNVLSQNGVYLEVHGGNNK